MECLEVGAVAMPVTTIQTSALQGMIFIKVSEDFIDNINECKGKICYFQDLVLLLNRSTEGVCHEDVATFNKIQEDQMVLCKSHRIINQE